MTPLFTSVVCDYCDGHRPVAFPYRGFVVWRGAPDPNGRDVYVFPTRRDAELYRLAAKLHDHVIREAWSEQPFIWGPGRGSIKGLTIANHVYTVFPDHRFTPGRYRACLSPPAASATSPSPPGSSSSPRP
jgi:hypothetical protein